MKDLNPKMDLDVLISLKKRNLELLYFVLAEPQWWISLSPGGYLR